MNIYGKLALFVGGTLFGSAGLKLLGSKDAKKVYTHVTAAVLRCKDEVVKNVETVLMEDHPGGCVLNEKRAEEAEAAFIQNARDIVAAADAPEEA